MTEVQTADGAKIETELPAEAVADLQAKPEEKPAPTPEKGQDAEPPKPAETPATKETAEPKAEEGEKPKEPEKALSANRDPESGKFKPKAKPISNLLAKNHEYKTRITELEAEVQKLSKKPDSPATDADIESLAKELYGDDEDALKAGQQILAKIVAVARKGFNPALPKEVQDLVAEREERKALEVEQKAFDTRIEKLAQVFKDEKFLETKDKIAALMYSDKVAPDGEPYADKDPSEIYFAYIKPEVEPGKVSAEAGGGGTRAGGKVIDFQEIFDRDDPRDLEPGGVLESPELFSKYQAWLNERAETSAVKPRRYI